jgi:transposase
VAVRCHIVLRAIAGQSNNAIAKELQTSRPTVLLWRERFARGGTEAPTQDLPRGRRIPP